MCDLVDSNEPVFWSGCSMLVALLVLVWHTFPLFRSPNLLSLSPCVWIAHLSFLSPSQPATVSPVATPPPQNLLPRRCISCCCGGKLHTLSLHGPHPRTRWEYTSPEVSVVLNIVHTSVDFFSFSSTRWRAKYSPLPPLAEQFVHPLRLLPPLLNPPA